ncbi:unnamed protein product, partial [Mesorhabditis spiculigera]
MLTVKQVAFCMLLTLPVIAALICETCDGESCSEPDRWVQLLCSGETRYCYRLVDQGDQVYRRGCTALNCTMMPGISVGSTCNVCDSDKCNGRKPIRQTSAGGGDVWGSTGSTLDLLSSVILCILPVLFVQ